METTRHTGEVTFFDTDRGFGFVKRNDGKDFFVHSSELKRSRIAKGSLSVGTPINFTLVPGNAKGPKCAEIELINSPVA